MSVATTINRTSSDATSSGQFRQPPKATIHLARHGERAAFTQRSGQWNQGWAQGRHRCHDDPLTPLGKEQAREAGRQLKAEVDAGCAVPILRVLCSPFQRCISTAILIAKELGVPVFVEYALCECLRTEWFKPEHVSFDDIYLRSLQDLKDSAPDGEDRSALGMLDPQMLAGCEALNYEDEHPEAEIPRMLKVAQVLRRRAREFAGSVLVTHGGAAFAIAQQLLRSSAEAARSHDLGSGEYVARASFVPRGEHIDAFGACDGYEVTRPFLGPVRFTPGQDWCSHHLSTWRRLFHEHLPALKESQPAGDSLRVLELGSWEGLSARHWLHMLKGAHERGVVELTLVDHFDVDNENPLIRAAGKERHAKLVWNLHLTGDFERVRILPHFSHTALTQILLPAGEQFDFMYVDADHTTVGVLSDLTLAWPLLRQGGLMLLDDYEWPGVPVAGASGARHPPHDQHVDHPKRGIDAFIATHKEQLTVLHKAYQVLLRKTAAQSFPFPLQRSVLMALEQEEEKDVASSFGLLAVLLPLTSKGLSSREDALKRLQGLAGCLPSAMTCALFVGPDNNDAMYSGEQGHKLLQEAFVEYAAAGRLSIREFVPHSPAQICAIACTLAKQAFEATFDGGVRCSYFVLLGDDVRVKPQRSWFANVRRSFAAIHSRAESRFGPGVPHDFGVVAIPDVSFPGFPTFPVVGRAHMEAFGNLAPTDVFAEANQDMDPFLFEVYRSFGAREFCDGVRLANEIGGDEHRPARYERVHAEWKHEVLRDGVATVRKSLASALALAGNPVASEKAVRHLELTTLDVITPSYRCDQALLRGILALPRPSDADVRFIVIIDEPSQDRPDGLRQVLERDYGADVRVRVNKRNMGASYSRNRGMEAEATADWLCFLDDDVVPDPWLLTAYVSDIRERGHLASGFVGLSNLPQPSTFLTAALAVSYLTYFWPVALYGIGGEKAPWAVTANVVTRRPRHARFDEIYAKTGGGEDIAFELSVVREFNLPLLKAIRASVTHPWWDHAQPSVRRFFSWAASDSQLMLPGQFPEFNFRVAPNSVESGLLWLVVGLPAMLWCAGMGGLLRWFAGMSALWIVEAFMDVREAMLPTHTAALTVQGWRRAWAALLGCVYKNANQLGHALGPIQRDQYQCIMLRWDWWCGLHPEGVRDTNSKSSNRAAVFALVIAISAVLPLQCCCVLIVFSVLLAATCAFAFVVPSSADPRTQLADGRALLQVPDPVVPLPALAPLCVADARPELHLALVSDDSYAAPLAVALHSLAKYHTDCQLHLHVLDAGMSDLCWSRVQLTMHEFGGGVTLSRVPAPARHCAPAHAGFAAALRRDWPTWSKLWLDELLPQLEHVLYLDSDVLCRGSLRPAWDALLATDSRTADGDRTAPLLLAVRDFGLPNGHPDLTAFGWRAGQDSAYFNAGVLGVPLRRWRVCDFGVSLRSFACRFGTGSFSLPLRYKDQDTLNLLARDRWQQLAYELNVQGVDSYGELRCSKQHGHVQLYSNAEWKDLQQRARLVHFTGCTRPTISAALSPYVPVASKPWSWCASRSVHPLVTEWRLALKHTGFAGWRGCALGEETPASTQQWLTEEVAAAVLRDCWLLQQKCSMSPALVQQALVLAARTIPLTLTLQEERRRNA